MNRIGSFCKLALRLILHDISWTFFTNYYYRPPLTSAYWSFCRNITDPWGQDHWAMWQPVLSCDSQPSCSVNYLWGNIWAWLTVATACWGFCKCWCKAMPAPLKFCLCLTLSGLHVGQLFKHLHILIIVCESHKENRGRKLHHSLEMKEGVR